MQTTLPLTCVLCGLRFTSEPMLELHIREDHGPWPTPEDDHDDHALRARRSGAGPGTNGANGAYGAHGAHGDYGA